MNVPKSGSTILNTQRRNVFLSVFGLGSQMNPLTNLMAHLGAFCQDIVWWQYWKSCHIFIRSQCKLNCGCRPGSTELKRNCKGNNRLDQTLLYLKFQANFWAYINKQTNTPNIINNIILPETLLSNTCIILSWCWNWCWFLLLLYFFCCGQVLHFEAPSSYFS